MLALTMTDEGPRIEEDRPRPRRGPREATVRLLAGGICATDLEITAGYAAFRGVMGHEWVGIVEEADDTAWTGRRVVGDINVACGTCASCTADRPNHCASRQVLGIRGRDGAFAERFTVPVRNLHRVPEGVCDDQAVFVEPLAAALRILEQVRITPADTAIVLGVGRLGQLCCRVLQLAGARVFAVGRTRRRMGWLPPGVVGTTDVASLPRADVVVDCTGSPDGLALAARCVRPCGTVVLKTTTHGAVTLDTATWVVDEITVVGSRCGPFAPALHMLEEGTLDLRPLITGRFALRDGVAALEAAAGADHLKVLLTPDGS